MKLWRGIHTSDPLEAVVLREFGHLSLEFTDLPGLLLSKILDNHDEWKSKLKLTSFTTSREIALRYADGQGWLLELEVDPAFVFFPEGYLETRSGRARPGSEEHARITEALDMVRRDSEVYLKAGARIKLQPVTMVAGILRSD